MSDHKPSMLVPILAGGALAVVLVVGLLGLIVLRPASPASPSSATSPGGVDFTVTPRSITRNAAGGYVVEAEIARTDDWTWDAVTISDLVVIARDQADIPARVIAAPPARPVPGKFVVRIETDPIGPDVFDARLRFTVNVDVSRNFGLTKGNSSRSQAIPLEPTPPVDE